MGKPAPSLRSALPEVPAGEAVPAGEEVPAREEVPAGEAVSAREEVPAREEVLIQGRATNITTVTCSPALAYVCWAHGGHTTRVSRVCAEQS